MCMDPNNIAVFNTPTAVEDRGLVVGRAAINPASNSQQSRSGRAEARSGISARQNSIQSWGENEVAHLMRLADMHKSKGRIEWVKVERVWATLSLPKRTKAALIAKWRAITGAVTASVSPQGTASDVLVETGQVRSEDVDVTLVETAMQSQESSTRESVALMAAAMQQNQVPPVNPNLRTTQSQVPTQTANSQLDDSSFDGDAEKVAIRATFKRHLGYISSRLGKTNLCLTRLKGAESYRILGIVDECIKQELNALVSPTWEQLTALVAGGALTVSSIQTKSALRKTKGARDWECAMKTKIDDMRKVIGKATAEVARRKANKNPTRQQIDNIRLLRRKYNAETNDEIGALIELLKNRLRLLRDRLELHNEDVSRQRLRNNFNMKFLDRTVTNSSVRDTSNSQPDLRTIRKFWKGIVGISKPCNLENADLRSWAESLKNSQESEREVEGECNSVIDPNSALSWESFKAVLDKAKPWKAPGPDGLQSFWWKAFKTVQRALYGLVYSGISKGLQLPKWLTNGRVALIYKAGSQADPANYRPIACLNTSYKLMTALLAAYLERLAEKYRVLPAAQVAIRKGTWGCTHAMLLDQAVIADATAQKQKPLHMAWIDYAKAFDSVPHKYIKWVLQSMSVPGPIMVFISDLMAKWTVQYEAKISKAAIRKSAPLAVRSGVLQGDSFSPLLFCLAMAPLSHAIDKLNLGYESAAGGRLKSEKFCISHLFYMDDLKIYSTSADKLDVVLEKVGNMSAAISMLVNAKKCARASFQPRRLIDADNGLEANSNDRILGIKDLECGEVYKYLGIEQRLGLGQKEAWKRVSSKFEGQVRKVLNLNLTYGQKIRAINSLTSVVTYVSRNSFKGSGKFQSSLKRGDEFDTLVRKLLVESDARYRASSVARLYLPTNLGGCGLTSVRDSIAESTIYGWAYLVLRQDLVKQRLLFQALANRGKRSIISDAEFVLEETGCTVQIKDLEPKVLFDTKEYDKPRDLARSVVGAIRCMRNTVRLGAWKGLVAAGKVLVSPCYWEHSFTWLKSAHLSAVAVRNVLAAQEGCLLTRTSPGIALPG